MTDWQQARSANGQRLADHLELVCDHIDGNARRSMRRWRAGFHPSFYEADRVLTRLGLHAMDVPERIWRTAAPTDPRSRGPRSCENCGRELVRPEWHTRYCKPACAREALMRERVPA